MQHRSRPFVSIAAASLVASALVASPPASAAVGTFTQPETITIAHADTEFVEATSTIPVSLNDTFVAVSTLELEAPKEATLSYVGVTLGLAHGRMDDLDIVLVTPSGQAMTLLSDVGGDDAFDGDLYFNRSSPGSSLSDDAMCGAADDDCSLVGPGDFDTPGDSDALPVGVPVSPPADFAALGGSSVAKTWTLYVVDDSAGDKDGMLHGWSLEVYFALPADPSPSSLAVGAIAGAVTDVDLTLHDVDARTLDETELVLESPDGRRAHVLSDAVFGRVADLELTLDDEAASVVPHSPAPVSGSYRPFDYDGGDPYEWVDTFDTAPLDSALSTFDGAAASGTWKLYVQQEYCCVDATIGGWSLRITTADRPGAPGPPAVPVPVPATAVDTTAPVLSAVELTPKRLPTGVGARLRVASTETARLVGVVQRRRNAAWTRVGIKSWTVLAGANTRKFYGKTAQTRLRSGTYRVLLVATDAAGNASTEVRRRFQVDRG